MLDKHLIAKTSPRANEKNIVLWHAWRVTVLSDRLVRLEKDENHHFCDSATLSVWFRDTDPVVYDVTEGDANLTITTDRMTLTLVDTLEGSFVTLDDGVRHPVSNRYNLLGTYRTLDECNGAYRVGRDWRVPIQLDNGVLARRGVAVIDDTTTGMAPARLRRRHCASVTGSSPISIPLPTPQPARGVH